MLTRNIHTEWTRERETIRSEIKHAIHSLYIITSVARPQKKLKTLPRYILFGVEQYTN